MEMPGRQALFSPFCDPVMAFFAHMGVDRTVTEALGLQRIVFKFFDFIADDALNTHRYSSYSTRIAVTWVIG